jgi:hypothetical protein
MFYDEIQIGGSEIKIIPFTTVRNISVSNVTTKMYLVSAD